MTLTALNNRRKKLPLPSSAVSDDYGAAYCGKPHHVRLFPAALREKKTVQPEVLVDSDQSSCFFHANFPATSVCSISGRFICDLCTTEWEGKPISLSALQDMQAKGTSSKLTSSRILWDEIALLFTLLIITGPLALFITLWFWRKGSTSLVPRSKIRYVIAGTLGALETALLIFVIIMF